MENIVNKKNWIKDTALFFYQIFSVEYEDVFIKKLLAGGGGNSTLCSAWMHLNSKFVSYRISKKAYELLITKIEEIDKSKIKLINNTVYIPKKIFDDYHRMFFHNAKGVKNRVKAGKFFHFDHNPSNKKVLELINKKIKEHKKEDGFQEELADYIETVQTIDLITVYEDEIRTSRDLSEGPLPSNKRDEILDTDFYELVKNDKNIKRKL